MSAEQSAFDLGVVPEVPAPRRGSRQVALPGTLCQNDRGETHELLDPAADAELRTVWAWLRKRPNFVQEMGDAVEDAIYYVLDGSRTHRFDLRDERVDSDERRAVGTKLQYHVLENLKLPKLRHPDTQIEGIGVEIKGTIAGNWAIPREGQCGVTLLIQLDIDADRHMTRLMRTHRAWLRDGPNHDGKRGVAAAALRQFATVLYPWTSLRPNPLKMLTDEQRDEVFGRRGQEVRLAHLFRALPGVVIPRAVILTVCANRDDPLRRARATRPRVRPELELLCGTWPAQRELAAVLGYDLTGAAWVAVPSTEILGYGALTERTVAEIAQPPGAHEAMGPDD
ncbi:NaeI family type II restriction endonuclease [Dactylosporangium sp. CS-033363]|uniref:NaeI family type II restriction endonuclease n=1 Tax=Dactylosporangium sp. CS-033363 TaxID=3239935 RepID=UPI003D90B730